MPGASLSVAFPHRPLRLFALSDVHTDFPDNQAWLEALSQNDFRGDALVLAGDVSDDSAILEATLRGLKARFAHVLFVPGNHELWVTRKASTKARDSLVKLHDVLALCARLGVHTEPTLLAGDTPGATPVLVVPLLSWHHASFDTEPDIDWLDIPPASKVMTDYVACSWPAGVDDRSDDVARLLDSLNDETWERKGFHPDAARECAPHVVTASHFQPRIELCPEKRFLFFPNLTKAIGSTFLGQRVQRIRPDVHIYGHTHFAYDLTLDDGIRYIQAALAYPHERKSRMSTLSIGDLKHGGPVLIYDSAGPGAFADRYECRWSDYYASHQRQPESREVPEWVSKRYKAKEGALS